MLSHTQDCFTVHRVNAPKSCSVQKGIFLADTCVKPRVYVMASNTLSPDAEPRRGEVSDISFACSSGLAQGMDSAWEVILRHKWFPTAGDVGRRIFPARFNGCAAVLRFDWGVECKAFVAILVCQSSTGRRVLEVGDMCFARTCSDGTITTIHLLVLHRSPVHTPQFSCFSGLDFV